MSAGQIAIVILFNVLVLIGITIVSIRNIKEDKAKKESQRLQGEVNKIKIKEYEDGKLDKWNTRFNW